MAPHRPVAPFLFPRSDSAVLPDTSTFFAPHLLSAPLPTNSFFQNFVLGNGDVPEYIHPYLVRSSGSSGLTLCYPSRFVAPLFIYQVFTEDLTISAAGGGGGGDRHVVSAFDDLSVTLDLPSALRFFLVRGSPFVTCTTTFAAAISIATVHAILSVAANPTYTKHTILLNSGQTFVVYSSAPVLLTKVSVSLLQTTEAFTGVLRFAYVPDPSYGTVLDRFSGCYPVSGDAVFSRPFTLEYRWRMQGAGDLLLLANPLQLRLLSRAGFGVKEVLDGFRYNSMDGDLVGVVGNSWVLKTDPIPITWHSISGVAKEGYQEVVAALRRDVDGLRADSITTTSSYFYGKAIARAARLALIAEEVDIPDVIPAVRSFLRSTITPWLDGSFQGNGFLYDPKWGGVLTKQGLGDSGADFGFGVYNDHHYHLGYFLYAIAVLSKLDPAWGRSYMPQAYSMVGDFMNLERGPSSSYTRVRNFDFWKLHSWAGGLTEFADGRNQESTSEAVNAYYSAALVGLSYGDADLFAVGSTLAALEIRSAVTWWHVRQGEGMYEDDFSRENKVVGVLWANKRDSALWFAPPEWKECRLGIQVLPLLPITEALFRDTTFARDLVNWTVPALAREGVGEGWKGFVYALEAIYDKGSALVKTRALSGFDDGNSLSNMLWWLHSRCAVVFAKGVSSILPALFAFFAPELRSSPLPTNSFFQNFVLGNGDLPEYIHPYLIQSNGSSLSLTYPSRTATTESIQQVFSPELTISAGGGGAGGSHVVSAFDDLSVTLDLPPALRFFLVRGSPYITCSTTTSAPTTISAGSKDAILSVTPENAGNKHKIQLNSGRIFLVYASSPVHFSQSSSDASVFQITEPFRGVLRVAYLPDPSYETVLDRFSGCYPVSGDADLSRPFSVEYRWGKQGTGDLLLLAHPLHIRLLSRNEGGVKAVLGNFKYNSIDGQLVGVVGDSWVLKTDSIPVGWHSTRLPVAEGGRQQVIAALRRDVKNLTRPIPTNSSYFYGKAIARAARLALIAEEVSLPDVIPAVMKFLEDTVTPWLDGSFQGNGFLYDPTWGGLVTRQGLHDPGADFGFGVYNDHHFHLGYFLYAIAVLSKLNQTWGRNYMPQAYAMMGDFMTLSRNNPQSSYTRLRNFDLWKLHSWASGLTQFDDGRNQESTSEAVNAYYSAALMGLSYGDAELFNLGSTLAALEIQAAVTWWHVREREGMYEEVFSKEIRVVGILWANKRDSRLWFGNTWETEKKLGIQVLPLLPVTEVLFRDVAYTRELVKWASPALERPDAEDGWKGFVYALEGVYDKQTALVKTRKLRQFDDGNSLSNMLWWLHS
ncbi:hypothetical protein Taro_016707, partial [Colocasia esculenta]|nr:hypothetical protein [Colocasia esculenta]